MAQSSWKPSVGGRLVVSEAHRVSATLGGEVVLLPGTQLEVEDLDLRWDNHHATIWRPYVGDFRMRVLDGGASDAQIEVKISGAAVDEYDREHDRIELPAWLSPAGDEAHELGLMD